MAELKTAHPESYDALVKRLMQVLGRVPEGEYGYGLPDAERITVIDYGEYQGTRVWVIGGRGYQPSEHWAIVVGYGSCSTCDTFEGIRDYNDDPPTDEQARQYWTLMLHMLQGMKALHAYDEEEQ